MKRAKSKTGQHPLVNIPQPMVLPRALNNQIIYHSSISEYPAWKTSEMELNPKKFETSDKYNFIY
jgi:hypothetical protein